MSISIITNGLLLTPEVVDRLLPYGLRGVKITLDGDRDTHNRMRPLRGGQGTFDRLIENIRSVAGRTSIAIGGNFDESSADSYSALLDFLREQDFADKLVNVNFKPIVRNPDTPKVSAALAVKGMLPLIPVGANGKPLNGTCMSNVGDGGGRRVRQLRFSRRQDEHAAEGDQAARLLHARTASTAAPATSTTRTRTRSGRTGRCTRAPDLPAKKLSPPATSTAGTTPSAKARSNSSSGSIPGTNARTARLSPRVQGDASLHRTPSLAT